MGSPFAGGLEFGDGGSAAVEMLTQGALGGLGGGALPVSSALCLEP